MTNHDTGFIGALFDFSFTSFITAKLIKVLYGLGLLLAGFMALAIIATGLGSGIMTGLGALVLAPIAFLFVAMYMRVVMEVLIVLFRISENVSKIADRP